MHTSKKAVSQYIGLAIVFLSMGMIAQPAIGQHSDAEVTYADDIAPILNENCVKCHRPAGVAPMSLTTYEEAQPWAPLIMYKTQLRDKMGAMPPYYLERGIGIQHVKDDERLSEEQIQMIATWAQNNAPMGLRENIPPVPEFDDSNAWRLGGPDLVVRLGDVTVKKGAPDSWISDTLVPIGLTEDRYVSAVEMREVNNADSAAAGATVVGGLYIFHHMSWATVESAEDVAKRDLEQLNWPVHELGRNPDIFDPKAGRLLKAGTSVLPTTYHLHSNGQDTTGHMELGFYFHPKGYEPEHKRGRMSLGDGLNISIQGNLANQELHTYTVLQQHTKISSFEPHLHGPGARMCLEAIWGNQIETLACSGYDHNWVKQYTFEDDYAPLLPKGTIVHMIGFMDNTQANTNVADARNWSGSGNASITNMFLHLGQSVTLTDQQFVKEMADRRERLGLTKNDHLIGCPLCLADLLPLPDMSDSADGGE
ncbi:MAG: cytochrome c [Gammaproteobacteria bacterium]|nr:cytochrome c [Gammaproteobacteria bacterium]